MALAWRLCGARVALENTVNPNSACGAHVAHENKDNLKQNEATKSQSKLLKILNVKRTKRSIDDCGAHVALEVIPVPMWEKVPLQ